MAGAYKFSFKSKLFIIIAGVLSVNVLIMLLFGSSVMETYYTFEKEKELEKHQKVLGTALLSQDTGEWTRAVNDCESANINILIYYRIKEYVFDIRYRSRTQSEQTALRIDPVSWLSQMESSGIFNKISSNSEPLIDNILGDNFSSIQLYSQLDSDLYLSLETPKDYIGHIANLAVRFVLFTSLITLIVGITAAYFITARIARPIRRMDSVAKKIAKMDFSEKCPVESGDELGQLSESINIMSDKLKENIDLLKHDLEREEKTNNMRREFMANVSHDFKTPLALISAYTEAIRDGHVPNGELKDFCDTILEQSITMSGFVTRLLNLSQLESGMISFDMTFFCINDIVISVIKNCRILLNQENITCDFSADDEYIVKGDYSRITQVFTNLFENAIKYVDQNKDIRVKIADGRAKNSVRVSIFNSIENIPADEIANLFDQFYKRDKSRGINSKSYGLGLAIVKAIMNLHNCGYGIYNTNGGVVFWFELIKEEL